MLLSLPVFAPEVPAVIEFTPAGERSLRLVLAMSRVGMILDDDLASLRRTRTQASHIRRLIESGWERAVGHLFNFRVLSAYARLILPDSTSEEEFTSPDDVPLVGLAINSSSPEFMVIGPAFTAIENQHPGLGKKALDIVGTALAHFGMPHIPTGAFELCQQIYWMGEEDETAALEEYGDEADEADVPRRAVLFDGIPEWAYLHHVADHPVVDNNQFHALALTYRDSPTGDILTAIAHLLQLEESPEDFAPPHEEYSWPNEPPIACGWNADNEFEAVYDDNYRYYCEGGEEAPWSGCVKFAPTEEGIANALPTIRHTGQVLSALDAALCAIKEFS